MKRIIGLLMFIFTISCMASYLKNKTINYSNGDKYVGQVVNGKRHGYGTYYFNTTGDRFTGNWVNGKRTGYGTYYYANGTKKSGYWKDSKYVGKNNLSVNANIKNNNHQKQFTNKVKTYKKIVPKSFIGQSALEQFYEDCIESSSRCRREDRKDRDGQTVQYLFMEEGGYIAIKSIPCNQCFLSKNCRACLGTGYSIPTISRIQCKICHGTGKCQACEGYGHYYSYAEIGPDGKGYFTNNGADGKSYYILVDENKLKKQTSIQYVPNYNSNNNLNDIISNNPITPEQKFCPSCGGIGYHTRGGHVSPSSPIFFSCEFCGKEYNIEFSHTCKCNYCGGTGFVNR